MGNKFASGKHAIAVCDRCGFQYKLTELKKEIVKGKIYNLLVCRTCWDPDHPQLHLGEYPVDDPQAVRNPRPDLALVVSRDVQWGWGPVGGGDSLSGTPNDLVATGSVGDVTVSVS